MVTNVDALRTLAELRPHLAVIREHARLACALNPLLWIAVQGVSLSEYLAKLDGLDDLCRKAGETHGH